MGPIVKNGNSPEEERSGTPLPGVRLEIQRGSPPRTQLRERTLNIAFARDKIPCTLNVYDALKCLNCNNLAIFPVSSCSTGHLSCSVCSEILAGSCAFKECGNQLSPCPFAENLLKSANISIECRNFNAGCNVRIKPWKMQAHLVECEYQSIICFDTSDPGCGGVMCYLKNFVQHIQEMHKGNDLRFGRSEITARKHSHFFLGTTEEIYGQGIYRFPTDYFYYCERTFLMHTVREDEFMYWWITLLGTETEASKFDFLLKIKQDRNPRLLEVSWRFPMHSIFHFELKQIKKTGHFACTHVANLKGFKKPGELNEITYDYIWSTFIEVIKPWSGKSNIIKATAT